MKIDLIFPPSMFFHSNRSSANLIAGGIAVYCLRISLFCYRLIAKFSEIAEKYFSAISKGMFKCLRFRTMQIQLDSYQPVAVLANTNLLSLR